MYWKIMSIVAILGISALVQYVLLQKETDEPAGTSSTTPFASSTIPDVHITDSSGGGYIVTPEPLPNDSARPKAPDVNALIADIVPKNDYEKLVFSNLTKARDALRDDPKSYNDWLTVGTSLKQLEEYKGASDAWFYVAALWPDQPVPHGNLGSLYHLYLKDFPKSEAEYNKAIALDPTQSAWHRGLYELYVYSYKTKTNLWEEALKAGISQSGSIDLRVVLAERYEKAGRFTDAVALYDDALAVAEAYPNTEAIINQIIGLRAAARANIK
ncbi:MAG: hypothetical protein A3C08_00975 [Candidatus Taylorbacteria bacterium RIFCSPHIGHO2_02_FULL_47_18]|uniref:Tetratricopeptide repeat protein n=1 Tax=Candidatus Taylorbacteria bacterium RIFCSPLOWO2_01_FULL_48_100 TaxID=1802322 RepID=A0A1G2NEU6_9BACT|nr:MAG: hypothetical protein A2670_01240 [Candidatus Taylorbacteria bacterium RIFCSPHIGHO2_01_FULL_48_38]OHA27541.1 MAG: hypothetical protein A3C08_00975 [Candidatus Taylorbacteria bacterium RIFCSPHIGHO2_02_FULL_47_18]OHA34605.1 MAG: hypothetical protein A2938_03595 [Candidatus Taylorbacteria bacterium RIFCSPLOWO2_01_FULL_48_100]OHA40368.1 MAG: hypothetical protein A3J31_02070 [Candidatus Taylorbacteria bacterium RIFCSPLOWO2_02_FULL_48_16]OHA45020.1 MAG: hypothetical protein A3H13_02075 [Candid